MALGKTALSLVLCASLGSGGCSFIFVDGPPDHHEQLPYFECTTSRVVPVLDTIWTVLQVANLAWAGSQSEEEWADQFDGDPPLGRNASLGLYVGLAALGAAGMYYGFTRTRDCREAKTLYMMRIQRGAPPPQTWPPRPQPWPPQPQQGWPPPQQPQAWPPPSTPEGAPAPPPS